MPKPEEKPAAETQEAQERRDRAVAWLEQQWQAIRQCVVCGHSEWSIGEVVELRLFQGGNFVVGGPIYPMVPVICNTCGNTLLINALKAGVVPSEDSDESNKTPDQ